MPQSALRALDQAYMMGIGQGPAPVRVPKTRGQTTADILGAASLPLSAVPIAGDIAGFAADAAMYAAYPEERTLGNYAMSVLGGLPLIPGAAALRAARSDSKAATNAINVQGIDIPIRKPSDNINNVMQANFNYPNIIGDQTLNINDIYGGVRLDPNEKRRVDDLSAKISGEGGFISRIIVDQDNNVVEGQHRLEALRQLGASEVPVYKIEDLSSTLPVIEMENAINNSGKIHPDNVNRIMQYALENIAEHGVDGARDFDFGNYQKYYDAALDAAAPKALRDAPDVSPSPLEGTRDMSQAASAASAGSQVARPVNEQLGIERARRMAEQGGFRWDDVKQITNNKEYAQFQREYGIPSAVSERDNASDVFNNSGALFFDEETGAPIAYATSSASRRDAASKAVREGLDMSTAARMQRAAEQGFTPTLYHGTAADVSEFNPEKFGGSATKARSARLGTWAVDNPDVAGGYARFAAEDVPVQRLLDQAIMAERRGNFDEAERLNALAENLELSGELRGGGGQNIVPLRARGNFFEVDAKGATMSDLDDSQLTDWATEAKSKGFDGLQIRNFSDNVDYGQYLPATHYLIFDPSNIRSVNAAFDPANRRSANILATAAGGTIGLSALRQLMPQEKERPIE